MTIQELEFEIEQLPVGYISRKVIRGKECYYHQWKEDGKLKSRYLKEGEMEPLQEEIARRRSLQEQVRYEQAKAGCAKRVRAYASKFFMGCRVPIGVQSYQRLIEEKLFYVDKTNFLRQWWHRGDEVTLITRPRRFGKTLNMRMAECFFSNRFDGRGDLFQGLEVWKHSDMRNLQGQFPVIFLTFGSIKLNTADGIINQLAGYLRFTLLGFFSEEEKLRFTDEESRAYRELCTNNSQESALDIIPFICKMFYRIYGKKTIILLDEYDTPMLEAWTAGVWKACAGYIRDLFNTVFKSNLYMERALLTGITRVGKEAFFSDLNHLVVAGLSSDLYSTSFGFTEQEVLAAMELQGLNDLELVKAWYDGFYIGSHKDIYNPWSIVNYLSLKEFKPYWAHSASNQLISNIFRPGDVDRKNKLEDLLKGRHIYTQIVEEIAFQELELHSEAVWSLLVASGYLKVVKRFEDGKCELALTNKEVHLMLVDMIRGWFAAADGYSDFGQALLLGDVDYMNEYMNRIAGSVFSYFDTADEQKQPERFYHGFILGLMITYEDRYFVQSNRESGLGRADVMLEPKDPEHDPAIIMEFKVHRPRREASLEETADAALWQIKEKNYTAAFIAKGIPADNIYVYGFAFRGKEVLIKGDREEI